MKDINSFLISIGFGKNETRIYSALIEMGASSVLQISKKTKMHRSNIYDSLRKLVEQGMVYETHIGSRLFNPRPLKSLPDYLTIKQAELKDLITEFEQRSNSKPIETISLVSKGAFAVKEAILGLLDIGETIYVVNIPADAPDVIGPILKDFHKKRISKKIVMNHIYNSSGLQRAATVQKWKYTQARVLPSKYDAPATANICGNRVVIILWDEDLTVFEINNSLISQTYKNYFNLLWDKSKVV